jgi:hypothetical protein
MRRKASSRESLDCGCTSTTNRIVTSTVTDEEIARVEAWVEGKAEYKRERGAFDGRADYDDARRINNDITGKLCEVAYAKLVNVPVSWKYTLKDDGGIDFEWRGWAVDVKWVNDPRWRIMYNSIPKCRANLIVLGYSISQKEFGYKGWIFGSDWQYWAEPIKVNSKVQYVTPNGKLNPPGSFFELADHKYFRVK